jgi:GT2 family glycosyltransferase
MATNKPLVSIVILNWNGLEDTKICLDSVRKLNYPNYEIILVDNGSKLKEKEYLSKLKDIIYIDNPVNRGFAGGQSDGFKQAHGSYILLLNNDAAIGSDYLSKAMPLFEDPQVAVVGGRSYFWNNEYPLFNESNMFYSYMEVNVFSAETTLLTEDAGVPQMVNTVSGSAVLVRKSAVDQVGYLYEPFFAYYEETDLFARMKRAGYKIMYSPDLCIWHRNGASSGAQNSSSFFYYHIFRNRFIYAMRNFETFYLRRFLIAYYKLAVISIFQIWRGPSQRRLGIAYAKALVTNLVRIIPIYINRRALTRQLGQTNYCEQILSEQLKLSIVLDARDQTAVQLKSVVEKCKNDVNPYHEYVLVINDSQKDNSSSFDNNVRFVIDRHYFKTHPINLGCLSARMPWLVIGAIEKLPDVAAYHATISGTLRTNTTVVILDSKLDSMAISKDYYQKIGGLSRHPSNLDENLKYVSQYSSIDKMINHDVPSISELTDKQVKDIKDQISYNNYLLKSRVGSWWAHYISHHYHIFQISKLIQWCFKPSIPIRLKLGRTKNLILFTLTLKRKKLATELRHIRNEVQIHSKYHGTMVINAQQQLRLRKITDNLIKNISDIPVFIICFERVQSLKLLVSWLENVGLRKIIFIDNDSSYPELIDYYKQSNYQLLRLYRNIGHTVPWSLSIIRILVPSDYYIVTDPDIIPTQNCPSDAIMHLASIHKLFPLYQKVGLGLKIDDLPDYYPLRNDVIAWERQFWQTQLTENIYDAAVDTTFALYKPFTFNYTLTPSLRTGDPYMARHLPWYVDPSKPDKEEIYYRRRANKNITSWNVDQLPERYQKEMNNA